MQVTQDMEIARQAPQDCVELEELIEIAFLRSSSPLSSISRDDEEDPELAVPPGGRGWVYVLEPNPGPGFHESGVEDRSTRTRSGRVQVAVWLFCRKRGYMSTKYNR